MWIARRKPLRYIFPWDLFDLCALRSAHYLVTADRYHSAPVTKARQPSRVCLLHCRTMPKLIPDDSGAAYHAIDSTAGVGVESCTFCCKESGQAESLKPDVAREGCASKRKPTLLGKTCRRVFVNTRLRAKGDALHVIARSPI